MVLSGFDRQILTTQDGLPSPTIRALALDEDGAMWLGTFGGLARFDGLEFRTYLSHETEGLEGDRVSALHLDAGGHLWIGTDQGPVSRYRRGAFEVLAPASLLSSVHAILEASDGSIWLGGDALGRWRDGTLEVFDLGFTRMRNRIRGLIEAPDGTILVACDLGVLRVPADATTIDAFETLDLETGDDADAAGFFVDRVGEIWVTGFSWDSIDLTSGRRDTLAGAKGRVFSQLDIGDGVEVLSTDFGLDVIATAGGRTALLPLAEEEERTRATLRTVDGTIWIGAETTGLIQLRPTGFREIPLGADVGVSFVARIPRDDGDEVLSMRLDDVAVLGAPDDPRSLRVRALEYDSLGIGALGVGDVVVDPDGVAWLATSAGVGRLVGDELDVPEGLAGDSRCIVRAEDGSLWAERDRAFLEVLEDEGAFGRSTAATEVWSREAVTWPGGFASVCADHVHAIDTRDLSISVVVRLPDVEIRDLHVDPDGTLWITSYGDGLFRRTTDGRVDGWTTQDGLPDVFLGWVGRSLGPDADRYLWLNSNSGAIRVDVSSLDAVARGESDVIACRLLPGSEGNGVAGAALADGRVVLPTIHGATLIDPADVPDAAHPPRLVIDRILAEGEVVDEGAHPSGVVDLEFAYTGIHFPSARRVTYQYRLDGYDSDWIDAGTQRVARYTNIGPGSYTFRLRARAADGEWTMDHAIASLSVVPLWYQRPLVQFVGVLSILAAILVGLRRRTRAILARSRALEAEIERRLAVEVQLRASRAEHLSVLEAAQGGIVTIDAEGTITYANPAVGSLFGVIREELPGRDLSALQVEGLRSAVDEVLGLAPGASVEEWATMETSAVRADGVRVDVELSLSRQDSAGEARAVCILRDVSERKRMTDRLRRSEERYRTLFHTAPAAIVVWRADTTIADWNEKAEQLFGRTRDGAVGRRLGDVFEFATARGEMRAASERVLDDRVDQSFTMTTTGRIPGEERLCRWRFTPVLNSDGTIRAVISLANDITEEQRVARDLDGLRRRLARAEETERSRIARELHDDLSQRLAALSLEMQIAVDSFERADDDPREMFATIQEGLQAVSTDVHALSRQLHPTVLDDLGLSRALRSECVRRGRSGVPAIEFIDATDALELDPDVALSLFRIAQESMQNATKHASASRVEVRLVERDGDVVLEVADDGGGFDPTGAGADESGGLGLASMRERARLVRAEIDVRSSPGRGTVVSVRVAGRRARIGGAS